MLTIETLRQALAPFGGVLRSGAHPDKSAVCVEEFANLVLGAPWGDQRPECVEADVHRLLLVLNDSRHWRDDAERTEVLLPAMLRSFGTAGDSEAMRLRAYRLADVAMRVIAADAMDSAKLPDEAAKLRALAPITDGASAAEARSTARAAAAAAATTDVGGDAAGWAAAAATDAAATATDAAVVDADAAWHAAAVAADAADAAATAAVAAANVAWRAGQWDPAAADAWRHQRWRRHVNLLLVAAGLADEVEP